MIINPRIQMQPQKMLKVYELVLQLIFHKSVFYLICIQYKRLPSLLTCPLTFNDFQIVKTYKESER